jgi:hypothetical protein
MLLNSSNANEEPTTDNSNPIIDAFVGCRLSVLTCARPLSSALRHRIRADMLVTVPSVNVNFLLQSDVAPA